MITVATTLFHPRDGQPPWGYLYTPEWVDKLYRGIARNYSKPFRMVCMTDEEYSFQEPIERMALTPAPWHHIPKQCYIILAERLVVLGLDTVIVGRLEDIFAYSGKIGALRDPYSPDRPCNGMVICSPHPHLASANGDDMRVLDNLQVDYLDDLFPGNILSYKVHVIGRETPDARIIYFHGNPKPCEVSDSRIIANWT